MGICMFNFITQAIDKASFSFWLYLNKSNSLGIIGGDSNLPEKKLIIKALDQGEIVSKMMEIKKEWINADELKSLTTVIYNKFSPYRHTCNDFVEKVCIDKQSFLSLLTLYNICNIALKGNSKKNKAYIKMDVALTEEEIALFHRANIKLKKLMSVVFAEDLKSFTSIQYKDANKFELFMNKAMHGSLFLMSASALANFLVFKTGNITMLLFLLSGLNFGYLFTIRVNAYSEALRECISNLILKSK